VAPRPQPDFSLITIGKVSIVEETDLLKAVSPEKHEGAMGEDHRFHGARRPRWHVHQARAQDRRKSWKMRYTIFCARNADFIGISLHAVEQHAKAARLRKRIMSACKAVSAILRFQPIREQDIEPSAPASIFL
jgi:hypothetical protein